MPELDLEGEEQVSHRKRSLKSEKDLPERGSSMCKGTEALNFPESHGFWWVVYEKLLRQLFPLLSSGHTGCVKIKEFQSWRYKGEVQNPAKVACDLFLDVASFLFLLFPVGAIKKMKEAECTCLGVAVM